MPTEARFVGGVVTQDGRRKSRRPSDNERQACDAVVRALESLAGRRRSNAHSPDDLGAEAQVEYTFDLLVYGMPSSIRSSRPSPGSSERT